jgi:hypothetical protein
MSDALNIRWTFLQDGTAQVMSAAVVEHRFDEHFHETWAIGCIDRGACAFTAAGQPYAAEAGDLVVLPPYMVHTGGSGDDRLLYRMAYVGEQGLARLSEVTLGTPDIAFSAVVLRDPWTARRLSRALSPSAMPQAERKALLTQALVALLTRHAHPRSGHALPRVSIDEAGRSESLLHLVGSPATSLSARIHRFTRRYGLSPRRYLRNLRCVSAKALLREGMPIAEVADALRFSDQAHFTREFKKVHHITPGGYRDLVSQARD